MDLKLECGFKKGEAAVALSHDTPGLDRRAVLPDFLHPNAVGEKTAVAVATEKRAAVIAQFDFEEKDGVLAWSAVGGEVFGRLTGNAKRAPGKSGTGLQLMAKGEFAPALFAIDEELRLPDTEYSVAFWFKTAAPDVRLCEAKRYSSYNNRWSDHLISVERGKLRFVLTGDAPLAADANVSDDDWHHVVSAVGAGGQKLYLDGKLVGAGKLSRRTRRSNRLGLDIGPGSGTGAVTFDHVSILGRFADQQDVNRLLQ